MKPANEKVCTFCTLSVLLASLFGVPFKVKMMWVVVRGAADLKVTAKPPVVRVRYAHA